MIVTPSRDTQVAHRNYVAHNANYETGVTVFQVLLDQGLSSTDKVCDVGCGSLRVGRYLITHLEHGNYYGIEPNQWLVDAALEHEVGTLTEVKLCHFANRDDFDIAQAFPDVGFDLVLISSVLAHASHEQMRQALVHAMKVATTTIFDTVPNGGPDNTGGWQYPQVASHYDGCVNEASMGLGVLTKLDIGPFGEQWWKLDK